MVIRFPAAGTTPPTHVAGDDHKPPRTVEVYIAGAADVKPILSTATPGDIPTKLSLCHVKIKRKVVPANEAGIAAVAPV